jgi:hypothetical protein
LVLRCLLGGQDEGLQMTKDEALKMALDALIEPSEIVFWNKQKAAITAIKAALEGQDESERTGQPYYWQLDAIQSAINMERENCARLCDAYELPDVAQAIRARGHR